MRNELDVAGAFTPAALAKLLTSEGFGRVTEKMIREDIAAGLPVNEKGKVELATYAAWLAKVSK